MEDEGFTEDEVLALLRNEEGVQADPSPTLTPTAESPPAPPPAAAETAVPAATSYGAAPGPVTAEQILADRPDVFRAFFETYYGAGNDRHSDAWEHRVGEATPEAYALYWYKTHGVEEGYGEPDGTPIDRAQLLLDRPDVFRAFYTEFYGSNNDRKSDAWENRVGGKTVEDYAGYWYRTYGKAAGYTQAHAPDSSEPEPYVPEIAPEPEPELPPLREGDQPITLVGETVSSPDVLAG